MTENAAPPPPNFAFAVGTLPSWLSGGGGGAADMYCAPMRLKKRDRASSPFCRSPPSQSTVQLHAFVTRQRERERKREERGEEANFPIEGFISINSVLRTANGSEPAEDNSRC